MIDLKENLVSRHTEFKENNKVNANIDSLRNEAIELFSQKGFPSRKDEEWKYTNLAPLLKADYALSAEEVELSVEELQPYLVDDIDTYKAIFVNGKYSPSLSTISSDEVEISTLAEALVNPANQEVFNTYYNKILKKSEGLVDLNTAFAQEGMFINVPKNTIVSKPVEIVNILKGAGQVTIFQPRNLVILGDNSKLELIDKYQSLGNNADLTNAVTEISVGKNADVFLYKFQNDTDEVSLIDNTFIGQQRDSRAHVFTFSFGGKIVRNNLNFYQYGENCNSVLDGITVIEGKQHVDHHTFVEHNAPNCESHELYKGIYGGKAKGVFNGKIYVHKEAQKLNAFQQNNNVLLSDGASINSKPQLEIFADDVKCSHGCTVGQLEEDSLFYMQQRGIPKKEAQAMLLYAFAADALRHVKIPQISTQVNKVIAAKLGVSLDFEI